MLCKLTGKITHRPRSVAGALVDRDDDQLTSELQKRKGGGDREGRLARLLTADHDGAGPLSSRTVRIAPKANIALQGLT